MSTPNPFKTWMDKATPDEKKQLAALADTSVATLRLTANAYRTGGDVSVSAEFAGRIEQGIKQLGGDVAREQLCTACASCPYQIACNTN